MTITATRTTTHTDTHPTQDVLVVPTVHDVQAATTTLLRIMTDAGPDDPGWLRAGRLVTAAAERLRDTLGTPRAESSTPMPPIVREADFARASRPLLRGARIADPEAAREFLALAADAALALR
ncbi:hypothetical protein [Nocardioides coralli]|uniref:hypothetical protein n=1 Tax=Nocardioides coralli TaxID=2872154 RepID=UPI001CA455C9|nr:hypothetical protein [Nocardioides coralli]QZY27853.1 hypothetical protein K6T13_10065 [Nocardioides coralli]